MNRKQRRQQSRSKSITRQAGVTYLTVAGVIGGSLGVTSTAQAAPALITNCAELETELTNAYSLGGTINANFSGTCDFAEGFIFGGETTITGPTDRSLTIRFGNSATTGFSAVGNLTVSNLNLTRSSTSTGLENFIYSYNPGSDPFPMVTVSNTTFSNASVSAAIYAEGQLTVSDSVFTNLNVTNGAIYASSTTNVSNSTFISNTSVGSGGAISSGDELTITNSTFESNAVTNLYSGGGAVYAPNGAWIQNSTFKSNTAPGYGGAVLASNSLRIDNSSFESNKSLGDADLNLSGGGGAVYNSGATLIEGSTFFENQAIADNGQGGAILTGGSSNSVNNSTFVGNQANSRGAALAMYSEGYSLISNSTFWNNPRFPNTGPNAGSAASLTVPDFYLFANILANSDDTPVWDNTYVSTDLGANLLTDSSFAPTTSGLGASRQVTSNDLKLGSLALNRTTPANTGTTKTLAIGPDSIARDYFAQTDEGVQLAVPDYLFAQTDQRGVARPVGAGYDVGAYETDGSALPNLPASPSPSPTPISSNAPAQAVTATIADQRISFAPGSSKLSATSKKKLRTLATEIKSKGLKSVNLNGHTATLTKAAPSGKVFRVKLSRSRSAAVQKYLMQELKKANYSVTFTKSPKGAANPLKSNKTEKGRIDNRRVEIGIN